MLKEFHVLTPLESKNPYQPILLNLDYIVQATSSNVSYCKCDFKPDFMIGDHLTTLTMFNGEIIDVAEDYDWIRDQFMLKEFHVAFAPLDSKTPYQPILLNLDYITLIRASNMALNNTTVKNHIVNLYPNCTIGDYLTEITLHNGEKIYVAEDYDWIREHC